MLLHFFFSKVPSQCVCFLFECFLYLFFSFTTFLAIYIKLYTRRALANDDKYCTQRNDTCDRKKLSVNEPFMNIYRNMYAYFSHILLGLIEK